MCFITENVRHRQKKPSFPLKGTYLCNLFYLAAQKTAPVVKSFHVLQVMMSHKVFSCKLTINPLSLREKCPNTEFFCFIFSRIRTEYGEIRSISPYSVRMLENTDQKKLHIWTLFTQCLCRFYHKVGQVLLQTCIAGMYYKGGKV